MERSEAANALHEVDRARRRSGALRGYAHAGSTVIVWGVIWLLCNLATYFIKDGNLSWMIGIPVGVLWSVARPYFARSERPEPADLRIPFSIFAALGFLGLVMTVTDAAASYAQQNVLISLLVAVAYVLLGIWTGLRFALLGLALTLVICLGWFAFPATLLLWLGLGGGGALILGGIWLARA
ncbi:hypothetical protein [Stakelama tenebrarum]|uniref:Uncharacterized protein n=1 Tax=Stakelama tenebrarum TaxID=2711215 RepID=A0A6G6Y9N7_9SPHN|nr:hypothetical protein [Sphingosinithalassobacter tenebrarum]QIG81645.1 hypothetical protein G5C33_18880 [Sphingosinithalassobacter tenebrarum]